VEQVLGNLLLNAARHAPGTPVHVAVRREGDHVCFAVRDGGRGLTPDLAGRVFDRFVSGRQPGSRAGLGLGLYIVRAIAEAHGGHVAVESEPGRGATFLVRLPAESRASA
jgi:signal transduction histidine kinase